MQSNSFTITAQLVDIFNKSIYPAKISVANNTIESIVRIDNDVQNLPYILPGFIDSHVHIESSMLVPSEFARLAVVHGTVGTISDPHEIANVCGVDGVHYMIENGKQTPFKFHFGAPSCVPATIFETAGDAIDSEGVKQLLQNDDIHYLAEMMNYPGVLMHDEEVMKKIAAAKTTGKPIDGHAPGLMSKQAQQYIEAGISTDHECFSREEALDKIKYGMHIIIREGSAAKNFDALISLLNEYPERIMFCSDDKHPDSLADGHINQLCKRAIASGIDLFNVLRAACINPVKHYKMNVGLMSVGDSADFIVVKDLNSFEVLKTYIDGVLVAENGETLIPSTPVTITNKFSCSKITSAQLSVSYTGEKEIPVIEALDGQLITNKLSFAPTVKDEKIVSNTSTDILKMVVVNRYNPAPIAIAWIKNFGFTNGAIASSVAHDSHNIVAVGVDDESLQQAINLIINAQGGVSCVNNKESKLLSLPVAGLMSADDGYHVAQQYTEIDKMAKQLGSNLAAPFMTLSFMALLVIPHLKLSDKGLFDGDKFEFINTTHEETINF